MKKASVSVMKKIGILVFCALIAFVFVSCDYFNLDIKQVLSEKLDTASVEKVEFPSSFVKNKNDVHCVPSNLYPVEFSVIVRNPRGYNLTMRYDLNDGTDIDGISMPSDVDTSDISQDIFYLYQQYDGSYFVRFNQNFIKSRELAGQRDISGKIYLTSPYQEFEPYSVTLRANTPPCEIENVLLQRDASGNYYVLCFEMCDFSPDSYGHIQDDVHVLNINGTEYYLDPTSFSGDFYTNPTYTAPCNQFSATDPGVQPLKTGGEVFEPSGDDGLIPIYFSTNVAVPATISAANEKTWSFFLEDDEGLTTETHKVSNIARQLKAPTVNATSGRSYTVGDDGYYKIQVTHDGSCLDNAVAEEPLRFVYTSYDASGNEISGCSGNTAVYKDETNKFVYTIWLPRGTYATIRVMVKKEGYTTSDAVILTNITIQQPANFYVSSEGHDGWTGTVGSPLRTIQYAIDKFHEEFTDETVCNIYVMDDITPEYSVEGDFVTIPYIECDDGTKTFNIIGYEGNRTIDARKNLDAPGSVIRVNSGAKLTMRNITITGGYAEDGGGLYIEGDANIEGGANVSLTNCTITENTAGYCGGGIIVTRENITFQMNGCTVSDNISSGNGGGMFVMNTNGTVTLNNCIFSGNIVDGSDGGGGIHIYRGGVELNACTFSGNTASKGGAIILRNQESASLKLDGATSIPAGTSGTSGSNDIYVEDGKSIQIGSNFTYSGAQALIDFHTYTQNSTVFTGYPAKASGKFKPSDTRFKIMNDGTLSIETNIYVANSANGGSSSGDGSQENPFLYVSSAITRIHDVDVSAHYIIHIKGTIYHANGLTITRGGFGTNAPLSVTICGTNSDAADTLDRDANSHTAVDIDGSVSFPVIFENLTIKGGNAYGNGNNGGGLNVSSGTTVTLKNCKVTGNHTATSSGGLGGGIYVAGNLTLDGTSVTGNTSEANGGGIYVGTGGTLKIKGKVTVTGNTSGSGASATTNNVYLSLGRVITIDGALDPASRIGVITNAQPHAATATSAADTVQITSGLTNSRLTADQLSAVFSSDTGYTVLTSNGECKLAVSGGSFGGGDIPTNNLTFAFTDAASNGNTVTSFYALSAKTVYMTVYEPGENDPISAADLNDISIKVKCGSREIESCAPTKNGNIVSFTIPNTLLPDNYTLYVTATYNGVTYDASLALEGRERLVATTPAPSGFVGVLGATVTSAVSDSVVFIDGCRVEIPDMYVCDHEVTQAEYTAVMGSNLSNFDGSSGKEPASGEIQENRPVERIEWFDAIMYCNLKSEAAGLTACYAVNGNTNTAQWDYTPQSGDTIAGTITCDFEANGYRLPTEAEWEYIARCGNNGTMSTDAYSGSNSIGGVAWYKDNSDSKTHEVKKKTANSLGIYDMCGNVWEWCWDVDPTANNKRIRRGGYYSQEASHCTVSTSQTEYASMRSEYGGFRVVRTVQ